MTNLTVIISYIPFNIIKAKKKIEKSHTFVAAIRTFVYLDCGSSKVFILSMLSFKPIIIKESRVLTKINYYRQLIIYLIYCAPVNSVSIAIKSAPSIASWTMGKSSWKLFLIISILYKLF